MTAPNRQSHPSAWELSLFAGRDLNKFDNWRVARHLRRCSLCEASIERFRAVITEVQRQAATESLTGFEAVADWARLEREMLGNIKVGLAASECIENIGHHRFHGWRGAAALAGLSLVFVTGWLVNVPRQDTDKVVTAIRNALSAAPPSNSTILQTTPDGIAVRSQGAVLTLLHPSAADVTISVNGTSSVGARYVDDETGQITITSVYGQ